MRKITYLIISILLLLIIKSSYALTISNSNWSNLQLSSSGVSTNSSKNLTKLSSNVLKEEFYNTINWQQVSSNISNLVPYLYWWKIFYNVDKNPVYQTNINIGYYTIVSEWNGKIYYWYTRYHWQWKKFLTDFTAKKTSELQQVVNEKVLWLTWTHLENRVVYYSKATNSLWLAPLSDWSTNLNKVKKAIKWYQKLYLWSSTVLWWSCTANKKECPKENVFNYYWGFNWQWKLNNSWWISFPYRKYNFTFSPEYIIYSSSKAKVSEDIVMWIQCALSKESAKKKCNEIKARRESVWLNQIQEEFDRESENSKKVYAYIAYSDNTKTKFNVKISTWINSWYEINNSLEPVFIQLLDNNTIIILYKDNSNNYTIEKHKLNWNAWVKDNLFTKNFINADIITDFYYDNKNNWLFISSIEKSTNWKFSWILKKIDLSNTSSEIKDIYVIQYSEKQFNDSYFLYQPWNWESKTLTSQVSSLPVDTVISSINYDTWSNTVYLSGVSYKENNAIQFIWKIILKDY